MNRQAWRVIVVKNKELIKDMETEGMRILSAMEDKTMYDRIMARGGTLFYNAPCLFMVPIDSTNYAGAVLDCGILCQNIALAATSLGLGSLICGMAGLAFAGGLRNSRIGSGPPQALNLVLPFWWDTRLKKTLRTSRTRQRFILSDRRDAGSYILSATTRRQKKFRTKLPAAEHGAE